MSGMKHSPVIRTQSFAAALVRSELIALNAPALEAPLCVGTALTAVAFFSTLIHIWNRPQRQKKGGEGHIDVGVLSPTVLTMSHIVQKGKIH